MDEEPRTGSWAPGRNTPTSVRPRPVPLPEPGTVLAERFVIEAVLGKGGTGVVYVARDRRLNQRVAIKLLHPDLVNDISRERLRREVQAARYGHANVVTVYDLHDDSGPMPFLSMELVEGRSLAHILGEERSRLDVEETIATGRQIAAALDHLHAHGLVHRDVKPSNILITANGTAKLCDLGLVRLLERGETLTATAMTVGTPAYMAPEQGSGGELTPAADVYALGLTLYECLTGKVPHAGDTAVETLVRRQRARPPALRRDDPACPRWLDRLLARMLEPRPALRPSATAVARALETRHVRRRISARAAATVAAGLALGAVGALGWRTLAARETVRVEVADEAARGVDAQGRPTWRLALTGPADRVDRADLDGDGRDEYLIGVTDRAAIRRDHNSGTPVNHALTIVSSAGRVVTQFVPGERILTGWAHPFSPLFMLRPQVADLDGDGVKEVLLSCIHQAFYPNLLFLYWPRWDLWDWVVDHTGRLLCATVVPDPRAPRILLLGVNNRLGMLPVYAEVEVLPPNFREKTTIDDRAILKSPQQGVGVGSIARWAAYVPLPQGRGENTDTQDVLEARDDGSVLVQGAGVRLLLDRYRNPVGGANAGRNLLRSRLEFLDEVAALRGAAESSSVESLRAAATRVRTQARLLLAEPPYRSILDLAEARALARAGDAMAARDLLRETWRTVEYEDVAYRLAHLEAITGDLARAAATLRPIIAHPSTPRGYFDGPHLLARIAIEQRDEAAVAAAADRLGRSEAAAPKTAEVAAGITARAHLWWDSPSAVDELVTSQLYTPDGNATACLVRWRLGRSRPDDIDVMRSFVANVPDAAPDGTLALAAAQLATGSAVEAIATLDRLVFTIALDAREDFAARQVLDLAQALRARALLAAGRPADARAAAAELAPRLRPGLLPAILCREVLDEGAGALAGPNRG